HSYLDNGPDELSLDFQLPINERWSFLSQAQEDIANNTLLQGTAGFRLKADCYQVDFTAKRNGFESADLHPSTDYTVNVRLLTFNTGDDTSPGVLPSATDTRSSL